MKNSSNLNMLFKDVFSLNKWNKKVGSPNSFGRKRPFISLNSSALIENLSSFAPAEWSGVEINRNISKLNNQKFFKFEYVI